MPADIATLLPPNATALERAIEAAMGAGVDALDADAIARAKDPWTCPVELLPFLAFERSVDLWSDEWPEWKKRDVIARSAADHRLKGTEAGARRYIDVAGGTLVEVLAPPQAIFAIPALSPEQEAAYIARHPKIRITLAHGSADRVELLGTYAGATFAGYDHVDIDQGPALHGRRAWLVRDGEQQPLQIVTLETETVERQAVTIERVIVPGDDADGAYAGHSYAGFSFVGAVGRSPAAYSYALDRSYGQLNGTLAVTTVPVGFEPIDTRWKRESEEGYDPHGIYAGTTFAGLECVTEDIAAELLADVLHLHDPAIAIPYLEGFSFAGVSRVGMPPHTAELLIDINDVAKPGESYAGVACAGVDFAVPDDPARRDALLEAVAVSKRASDEIGVRFDTMRPRTLADGYPLDGSHKLGGLIVNHL